VEHLENLTGKSILIVEDNYLVARHLSGVVESAGGIVVGPVGTTAPALVLVHNQPLDGALLNVELRRGTSAPVARALGERQVPYLVVSGLERQALPPEMQHAPLIGKPISEGELVEEAMRAFARAA
jgi:hypothetical protein